MTAFFGMFIFISIPMIEKRMKTYKLGERNIEMLESKNENALSYLQSLNYIKEAQAKQELPNFNYHNISLKT